MSKFSSDDLILEYLQGTLTHSRAKALESDIRGDLGLRERFFQLQTVFEDEVWPMGGSSELDRVNFESVRTRILTQIEQRATNVVEFETSPEMKLKHLRPKWNPWLIKGSLAVAAMLILAVSPALLKHRAVEGSDGDHGPAIVVYDIADGDGIATDLDSLRSGENIREVIYINRDQYRGLSRAEAYAEQLWAEYEEKKAHDAASIKGKGFVVFDLAGNQGFVGFYDSVLPEDTETRNSQDETFVACRRRYPFGGAIGIHQW